MGKKQEIAETPQQRAMAAHAAAVFQDYKQRWLPVQQHLASQIEEMGKPGSAARNLAAGKASTDTAMQFAQAQGKLEKGLTQAGAAPGSSRANLAITGMGEDEALAKGMGSVVSNQQIDQAYTQGLSALMGIGQGQRASVGGAMYQQAAQSGQQAQADAAASLQNRMGEAQLLGQIGGYGIQQGLFPKLKEWGQAKGMQGMNGAGGGGYIPVAGE